MVILDGGVKESPSIRVTYRKEHWNDVRVWKETSEFLTPYTPNLTFWSWKFVNEY